MLEKVNFNYDFSMNQENLFTPAHTKFDVTIEYDGMCYVTEYQCNTQYGEPTKENVMKCLILDAMSYEDSADVESFVFDFGYADNKESLRRGFAAYEGCKKTYEALHIMFTNDEIYAISDEIND